MTPAASLKSGAAVVIAVKNGRPYVMEAIESGLDQGSRVNEIIVVDDGSDDGTGEIVASRGDSRIRLVRNPDRGVSTARNFGVRQTSSEWLIFLDADDLLRPSAVDHLLDVSTAGGEKPVAVYGDYERIDEKGHAFGRRHLMRGARAKPSGAILETFVRGNFVINGGVMLVSRAAFDASGGFDPALSLCEDWHLWCRLAALGDIVYTPRRVMDYRVHSSSVMMGGQRRFADFRPALDRIYSDPAILSKLDPAILPAARKGAEVALMTYCASQAYRNGARWPGLSLAVGAIAHHPMRAPYVLARFAGAVAGF